MACVPGAFEGFEGGQTAGLNAAIVAGCGLRAWSKLPRMGIKALRAGKRQV